MWRIWRQKEHFTFADYDVSEVAFINYLQHHCAFVLVEPLGRLVDVIVGACIWASYDLENVRMLICNLFRRARHDGDILVVNAVVVDRRLQKVRVLLEPNKN